MGKRTRWGIALIVVLGLGMTAFFALLRWTNGMSAREEPSAIEKRLARQVRRMSLPNATRDAVNPVALTPVALARARAYFADHCAGCHDNDGRGRTAIGQRMYPRVPDMSGPETQSLTDGELFHIIKYGVRLTGMPGWGENTPADDEEAWKLVHFVRHLPRLGPEEIEEIRRLAPKTPEEWAETEEEHRRLEAEEAAQRTLPPPLTRP
jgi:mono/diheme cytochrome c family protein